MNRIPAFWMFTVVAVSLMAAPVGAAKLQVHDATVATSVAGRLPQGAGDSFPSSVERLYAFTRVVGAPDDTSVTHVWYHAGRVMAAVDLPVRSGDWRTWSSKAIWPAWKGQWLVEVVTEDGTVIGSLPFTVE